MSKILSLKIVKNKNYLSKLKKHFNKSEWGNDQNWNLCENNSSLILKKYQNYSSFLINGEVQSGKTINLIHIALTLFENNDLDILFYLAGTKNKLLNQNKIRFFQTIAELKIEDIYNYPINKINIQNLENTLKKENKKIIIHSLKTNKRLIEMVEIIHSFPRNINFLIVDDEADDTSLSLKSKELFQNIKNKKNVKFFCLTASPFANLYKNHDFYSQYICWKSKTKYQGIDQFKNNIFPMGKNENWKNVLKHAFWIWIETIIDHSLTKAQFLINIFSKKIKHKEIYIYFEKVLFRLQNKKILLNWFQNYKKNVQSFEKTLKFIRSLSLRENFFISNSENSDEWKNNDYEIIIGGLTLSRGLTFENLITCVMLNMGKKINAGTLLQRARWLGYRKETKNIMSIFINLNIEMAFEEIEDLIDWTKNYKLEEKNYKNLFKNKNYLYIKI